MLHIVVPARLGSSRLPRKMLARIGGKTVVRHAIERAIDAADDLGVPVILATDSEEIALEAHGTCAVAMTSSDCRTGTDRCAEVAERLGWPDDDIVVDVQADMPFLDPDHLAGFLASASELLGPDNGAWDMVTAAVEQPVVLAMRVDGSGDFGRTFYRLHAGLYAYSVNALKRFASLPTSPCEKSLRLEQLRAVENGFRIAYHQLPAMPSEINTPEDLAAAQFMAECVA